MSRPLVNDFHVFLDVKHWTYTVKQKIFASRKFLRISRKSGDYYLTNIEVGRSSTPRFAKFSCREMFLFYSSPLYDHIPKLYMYLPWRDIRVSPHTHTLLDIHPFRWAHIHTHSWTNRIVSMISPADAGGNEQTFYRCLTLNAYARSHRLFTEPLPENDYVYAFISR